MVQKRLSYLLVSADNNSLNFEPENVNKTANASLGWNQKLAAFVEKTKTDIQIFL